MHEMYAASNRTAQQPEARRVPSEAGRGKPHLQRHGAAPGLQRVLLGAGQAPQLVLHVEPRQVGGVPWQRLVVGAHNRACAGSSACVMRSAACVECAGVSMLCAERFPYFPTPSQTLHHPLYSLFYTITLASSTLTTKWSADTTKASLHSEHGTCM